MVHPGGRPRTVSDSIEENIILGQKMVDWVRENEPLHLSEWYSIEMFFTYNEWKTLIQKKEFLPYYEVALNLIGKQYLDKNSNVRDSISQRWQQVYFKDLKEHETEKAVFDANLKKEVVAQENQTLSQILNAKKDGKLSQDG